MDYIQVKNWENFQHYKDRTPPWIKLYNHLLDDFEFSCLPDASKAHLLSIWLLASRTENKIPHNPKWISNKISATEDVNLDILIEFGFLEKISSKNNEIQTSEQDASIPLQTPEQDACLEREERERREKEERKKKEQRIEDSFNMFWDSYHKKSAKAQAVKSFKSAIKREGIKDIEGFSEMLITDCKQRVSAKQFGFDNLNASTYLNNNRWEDEKSTPAGADSGSSQPDWMRGIL
jgi:hypothetical protein